MTVQSKSTDKMLALEALLEKTPLHRLKSIALVWEEIDGVVVPFLEAEYYDSVQEDVNENSESGSDSEGSSTDTPV